MKTASKEVGFYFAFPRLLQRLLGGSSLQSENNWVEAYGAGIFVYVVTYLYAVTWLGLQRNSWPSLLALVPLLFGVWIFWLVTVYLNALIIKGLRVAGWLAGAQKVRAQSVLIAALTTFFAFHLTRANSAARWLALAWLVVVALNLVASLVLAFVDDSEEQSGS